MTEIYLVMTSRQTWGKGPEPMIALYNACQNYDDIAQAQFYRFDFPKEVKWWDALLQINVNELGMVTYPKEVTHVDLGVMEIVGIPAKIQTIKRRLSAHVGKGATPSRLS